MIPLIMISKPCSVLVVLAFLSEIEQTLYRPGGYKLVFMLMIMKFALVIKDLGQSPIQSA